MGSALLIPTAQVVFQSKLVLALQRIVPELDPVSVLAAGATRDALASLPTSSAAGVVRSYVQALKYTFAIGIPFAGMAVVVSLFMPWFKYHDASKRVSEGNEKLGIVKKPKEAEQRDELGDRAESAKAAV